MGMYRKGGRVHRTCLECHYCRKSFCVIHNAHLSDISYKDAGIIKMKKSKEEELANKCGWYKRR